MKVAIIPARGGSKRIPRKNIRDFAGKPIIAWSIEAARGCGLFDRIIVSTDDAQVADTARQHGAEVPFMRPPELSDDFTGTDDVVRHAIRWLQAEGQDPAQVCCIYATAPFVTPESLIRGWKALQESGKAFAFSVATYAFPIQRALRFTPDGGVAPFQPECVPMRSQDLEPAVHDAGQFYWGQAKSFLDGLETFAPHSVPVVLPRWMVQDIDTEEDWQRAELMFQAILTMRNARA
ncbi:MAG: pseudaminic acid cytidylyltransferase [Zoogloea sp.]|nr:pseudaminic acid cytidylyltransferase [Zoogloea sp.]